VLFESSMYDVSAIETSSLLRHADHNDFFLFPARILAVVVVNGQRHGGIFKSLLLSYTHNNHRTRSRDPLKSERGVDCTPVGESEDFHTVYASHLTPLSHARPAYPQTCRHLRITPLYYTFILISYKLRLTWTNT
jgi:hypothetical protein